LIIKEKFFIKEQINFNLKNNIREDIKDKLDLVTLIKLSNYIYYIFNYIYTGIIILTINTLLYRSYRVSDS
jgi:hypothetical protein